MPSIATCGTGASDGTGASGRTGAKSPVQRSRPDVTVAIRFDWLPEKFTQQASACTNSGIQLTAGTIRRLACDPNLTPTILGSDGEVLEQGSAIQTVTNGQRRALKVRDGGCIWPRCSAPPSECDAHHVRHWADFGNTDLNNLALFCHDHHRLIHDGGYQLWKLARKPGFDIHDSAGNSRGTTQTRSPFRPAQETESPPDDLNRRRHQYQRTRPTTHDRTVSWDEPPLFDTA